MIELRTIPPNAQRALWIGPTRTGKTTHMQAAAEALTSVVVLDSKHQDWTEWAHAHGYVVSADPAAIRRHPRVVFQVDARSLQDRAGWQRPGTAGALWTEALESIMWRNPPGAGASTVAIFDEGMHSLPEKSPHPTARRIATQGAALGIAMWLGTQAPNYVDTVAIAMAEHCFGFALHHPEYRRILEQRRGVDCSVLAQLDRTRYQWAHHFTGDSSWTVYEAVPIRGRRVKKGTSTAASNGTAPAAELQQATLTTATGGADAPSDAPPGEPRTP